MSEPRSESRAIPAATLVIFRAGRAGPAPELLMVVRSRTMAFAAGMAVFPGGRVDAADRDLAAGLAGSAQEEDELAHRIAAIRETLEETGLAVGLTGEMDAATAAAARRLAIEKQALAPVLEAFRLALDPAALIPFARWLPLGMKHARIFDTRFYLADLGTGAVEVAVDATENTRLFWVSAADALGMADRGEIDIIFPTRRNLERLAQYADFPAACADAARVPIRPITPRIDTSGERPVLRIPEDAGYPVTCEELRSVRRS